MDKIQRNQFFFKMLLSLVALCILLVIAGIFQNIAFNNSMLIALSGICLFSAFLTKKFPLSDSGLHVILVSLLFFFQYYCFDFREGNREFPYLESLILAMVAINTLGNRKGLIYALLIYISGAWWSMEFRHDTSIQQKAIFVWLLLYPLGLIFLFFIEEIRIKNDLRAAKMTQMDPLTKLLNRSGFSVVVNEWIHTNQSFHLIIIDIDHFHGINLNIGNEAADQFLLKIANILKTYDKNIALCRSYGDRFSWISSSNTNDIQWQFSEISQKIKALEKESEIDISLNISGGMVLLEKSEDIHSSWAKAELALEHAKAQQKNCLLEFMENFLDSRKRKEKLALELNKAMEAGNIEVHYQPKISMSEKRVVGMEALVRWIHKDLGFIPPPEFIEVAENNGKIHQLGNYVMRKALAHFRKALDLYPYMTISINVSPLQLLYKSFFKELQEIVKEYKISPPQVYLEVTESLFLRKEVGSLLNQIRDEGFRLSLDDFGTGYSSMNYLKTFRFDELKVDKSFTDGLLGDYRERALFSNILKLAIDLGMETVIEGVETQEQMDVLRNMKAREIQGWFFSKALEGSHFLRFASEFNYEDFFPESDLN